MPTDDELIATCKSTPFEDKLQSFGCLSALFALPALKALGTLWESQGWNIPVGVAIGLCVVAIPVVSFLPYRRRAGAALKELKRRYPFPKRDELHKHLADKKKNCADSEWIVLLNIMLLPHGGRLYIEFDATNETTASLKILRAPLSWTQGKAASRTTLNLAAEQARELWTLLPAARECGSQKLEDMVMDGAPAVLLGWNRTTNGTFRLECNFSGANFRASTSALAKLATRLTQFQDESDKMLVGSYNGKEIILENI